MKRLHLIAGFMILVCPMFGQRVADSTWWYYFTDKENNGYSVTRPDEFLSQRSIDRRAWQSLPVDETDLPVTKKYIDSLVSLGLEVRYCSRWLNGVLVSTKNYGLADTLYRLSFIDTTRWEASAGEKYYPEPPGGNRFDLPLEGSPAYSYGPASAQVRMLRLDLLHNRGFTGKGVLLAVLDAGFSKYQSLPALQVPLSNGQVAATRNFVDKSTEDIGAHSHGTHVSSIIAANWPGKLMGAAPDVSLLLAKTEDPKRETRVEEFSWIEAAEWADSIGADIFNTSLGYTTFDDSTTNYTYADMDGKTAHISIANSMTARKGIISVCSAGNSGNDEWHYIGAPADASDIIAVGAADSLKAIASFSSFGPTYDNRVKPEVTAMGALTALQSTDGTVKRGFGTSYSSPMIAGATAVLWQACPTVPALELMQKIIQSADRYATPDSVFGYGIPSFYSAYFSINGTLPGELLTYPNPASTHVYIELPEGLHGNFRIDLFDMNGRIIHNEFLDLPGCLIFPGNIPGGVYILRVSNDSNRFPGLLIKQ